MATNSQESGSEGQNGLDFAHVLRDCLACAVITIDGRRKVTGINPHAEHLLNLKSGQLLGQSVELLPPFIQEIVGETFASDKAVSGRHIVVNDSKKGQIAIQIASNPIRIEKGKTAGVVVVLNNVSAVGKWETNLRHLDRLHNVGTLSASMAHEVKNAFVAVKTFVDLLLEQNKQADLAEVVRFEMSRIDSILGQMRKLSGPAKPAFSPVQLRWVLEKSLQLIRHMLEDKKIRVTRSFAASPDVVHGDQDQLEQAFLNLFFNALDAMKPNGKLTVSTEIVSSGGKGTAAAREKNKSMLRVTIHDDGGGIPAENLARLFEPFFTTKPEGTGLGGILAITRRIIQEHHGVITVQSEPNKGTSFSLVLPASSANV